MSETANVPTLARALELAESGRAAPEVAKRLAAEVARLADRERLLAAEVARLRDLADPPARPVHGDRGPSGDPVWMVEVTERHLVTSPTRTEAVDEGKMRTVLRVLREGDGGLEARASLIVRRQTKNSSAPTSSAGGGGAAGGAGGAVNGSGG